jgi:rhodanese-related sulfurtransferase
MKRTVWIVLLMLAGASVAANDKRGPVSITADISYVDIIHNGKTTRIQREQDNTNIIDLEYALTSRPCPPYCIQPMRLADGVDTIGELDVLDYLQRQGRGEAVLIIDSREAHWLSKGMIPGATHIPWQKLHPPNTTPETVAEILQFTFGVIKYGNLWDFSHARILVFYCNGAWCGQSPTNIRALLAIGYPPEKIKWYRGGMQAWQGFGLTTVLPVQPEAK